MQVNSSISTVESIPAVPAPTVKAAPVEERVEQAADHIDKQGHVATQERLAKVQTVLNQHDITMKFSQNETTNQIVIQLVDDKTGEMLRQMPNDVSLKLAAANVKLQGIVFDATV